MVTFNVQRFHAWSLRFVVRARRAHEGEPTRRERTIWDLHDIFRDVTESPAFTRDHPFTWLAIDDCNQLRLVAGRSRGSRVYDEAILETAVPEEIEVVAFMKAMERVLAEYGFEILGPP